MLLIYSQMQEWGSTLSFMIDVMRLIFILNVIIEQWRTNRNLYIYIYIQSSSQISDIKWGSISTSSCPAKWTLSHLSLQQFAVLGCTWICSQAVGHCWFQKGTSQSCTSERLTWWCQGSLTMQWYIHFLVCLVAPYKMSQLYNFVPAKRLKITQVRFADGTYHSMWRKLAAWATPLFYHGRIFSYAMVLPTNQSYPADLMKVTQVINLNLNLLEVFFLMIISSSFNPKQTWWYVTLYIYNGSLIS